LFDGSKILPMQSDWKYNTPPVFRAQLIDGSGSFKLSDFDNDSRSSALFLYPSSVGLNSFSFSNSRLSPSEPKLVKCSNDLASGGYSCKAQLSLGRYIPGNSSTFLRLGASYNKSSYRVKLIDSSSNMVVKFDSVQPEIDSTGRANDLFRRVLVRVELTDLNFPYPDMAVDIFGNFCKDFMVTSDVSDYASANVDSCRP
jgi:hypothetical protein